MLDSGGCARKIYVHIVADCVTFLIQIKMILVMYISDYLLNALCILGLGLEPMVRIWCNSIIVIPAFQSSIFQVKSFYFCAIYSKVDSIPKPLSAVDSNPNHIYAVLSTVDSNPNHISAVLVDSNSNLIYAVSVDSNPNHISAVSVDSNPNYISAELSTVDITTQTISLQFQ